MAACGGLANGLRHLFIISWSCLPLNYFLLHRYRVSKYWDQQLYVVRNLKSIQTLLSVPVTEVTTYVIFLLPWLLTLAYMWVTWRANSFDYELWNNFRFNVYHYLQTPWSSCIEFKRRWFTTTDQCVFCSDYRLHWIWHSSGRAHKHSRQCFRLGTQYTIKHMLQHSYECCFRCVCLIVSYSVRHFKA